MGFYYADMYGFFFGNIMLTFAENRLVKCVCECSYVYMQKQFAYTTNTVVNKGYFAISLLHYLIEVPSIKLATFKNFFTHISFTLFTYR